MQASRDWEEGGSYAPTKFLLNLFFFQIEKRNEFLNLRRSNAFTALRIVSDWLKSFDFIIRSKTSDENGRCLLV